MNTGETAFKTISKTISSGDLAVYFDENLEYNGYKLRVKIRSNAYLFQSYANIEIFYNASGKWSNFASIHYGAMKTMAGLIYLPNNTGLKEGNFAADRKELLRLVEEILN